MPSILVADDDQRLCELLKSVLLEEGYDVSVANDGEQAIDILAESAVDLLLLDVMMPKLNGLQTARRVCQRFSTPILMLTALADEASKIEGFEAGADQYLAKPFSVPELLVRIKAMLRRVALEQERSNTHLPVNSLAEQMRRLPFTQTEFDLIEYLMERERTAVSKADLQKKVLKRELSPFDRNLDMHISNIRRKLVQAGLSRNIIRTARGVGYIFEQPLH
ncbi:response regulator transcription factor [Vibrio sp. Of7-15]|uniref:response regulator transcription factor n=1 Tax=Vibrio sp. Of7-15 TaxID=2724879 RepID=UPI001EF34E7B|nr:response regulator transcription factor [Vibrio sp. Of7-15]MCG7496012.1 response regulator transcription factor [Vibrio sp. Of7-15]